jgi:ParB-like chromosome segregation protein Spo0J
MVEERAGAQERAAEGVEHLQAAALELIEAARAFLDVAEDLVTDRDRVADALTSLSSLAEVAGVILPGGERGGRSRPRSRGPRVVDDADADPRTRIRRIEVS